VRHENTSNCGWLSRDLLPTMAILQTGQCSIGGRGDDAMAAWSSPAAGLFYQLRPRVRWSAQYNVAAKATKAAVIRLITMTSIGI
jgi:hypothetical protein